MPILPLPHISVLVCHSSKSTECLPYVCSTLGAADTTGIRWSWARPSGSAHHTLFPTGRKELPYNSAASSCISWWLGMVVVIAHPSSCCAWHCVFLFYPVRLADQPLHCPRARAVYLLGEGGHVLSAQRDSNVQNSAQSQSLHFRWCHFLHGVENSSIFLPPLNYQHLYKGTFLGNPL